jgi:hypothetical protein
MTIEEDSNFILLHHLYYHFTGSDALVREQKQFLLDLAQKMIAMDTNGDGLPDQGSINTFDDAPRSINASQNQLYLGVKMMAALAALRAMPAFADAPESWKNSASAAVEKIAQTIKASWRDDHYPIAVGEQKFKRIGVLLPSGSKQSPAEAPTKPLSADDPSGYSNYLANGLVPLFLTGCENLVPSIPELSDHLINAHLMTETKYGDAHRDGWSNVWISQNIWRDASAMYLKTPFDFNTFVSKYWASQMNAFSARSSNPVWEGYCDSPENSFLTSYGRGVDILVYPYAERKMSLSTLKPRTTND